MRSFFIWIPLCIYFFVKPADDIDYKKVFGVDYVWAVNWLKQNDSLIVACASRYHVPPRELKAIVFPELIRYNRVFDAIEVESLKYLYVTEGKNYADFSVGFFQMKPSFAERVERDAIEKPSFLSGKDNESSRRERVLRLTNIRSQLIYLCIFYKICERRFSTVRFNSPLTRLKLFSTAYNAGYHRSYESLVAMQSRKHFLIYNYSDICAYYFLKE